MCADIVPAQAGSYPTTPQNSASSATIFRAIRHRLRRTCAKHPALRQAPGGRWRGASHEDGRRIPPSRTGNSRRHRRVKARPGAGRSPRAPFGMMFASSVASCLGTHMGEVVRFIPKSDLDRVRLIRESRQGAAGRPQEMSFERGDDVHCASRTMTWRATRLPGAISQQLNQSMKTPFVRRNRFADTRVLMIFESCLSL